MSSDVIQFREIVTILRRHALISALIVILCGALGVAFFYTVPKKFISKGTLNIQSAYFQTPLVGDLVANANDSTEYKAQREALLRYSLSDEFLDQLGTKFHLFRFPLDHRFHALERDYLLRRIQYLNIGSDNYEVSVNGVTGEEAYELTSAVMDQMISTLVAERLDKLNRAKVAIQANLEALKEEMAGAEVRGGSRNEDAAPPETLEEAETKLAMLEQRFTANHPSVVKERNLVERLREEKRLDKKPQSKDGTMSGSRRTLQDLYDDLLRKYNYLNIAINMEKTPGRYSYLTIIEHPFVPISPVFPKRFAFGLGGLVLGIVLSLLRILYSELRRGTFADPASAAQVFDVPFLGSLPAWSTPHAIKSLPAPKPVPQSPPKSGPKSGSKSRNDPE